MTIRALASIKIKEAVIGKNTEGVDMILARLGLQVPEGEPPLEIWPETGFSRVVSYTWGIKK